MSQRLCDRATYKTPYAYRQQLALYMEYDTSPTWLHSAVSTGGNAHISSGKVPEQDNPRFSKIADGVRYTQTLILYYHAVIIFLLLLLSVEHWLRKASLAWVKRANTRRLHALRVDALQHDHLEQDERSLIQPSSDEVVSSGSSTLTASTRSSQDGKVGTDECSPLLASPNKRLAPSFSIWSKPRAIMMYQPPPIPFVHKVLPENGVSISILGLLGINLFFLYFRTPLHTDTAFVLADRASVLFVANLPYLYILAAKNQPLQALTGQSYESLNIFHRRLGEWMCLLALIHTLGMTKVWYDLLRPAGWTFAYFLSRKIILLGLLAFICYELLYLTSLGSVRQRLYELFLATHIALQAAALVLVWFHHPRSRLYVGIALAIFLMDRLVFRIASKSRTFRASFEVVDSRQSWFRIRADVPTSQNKLGFGNLKEGWRPTQHAFVSVASLAGTHICQAHPFTIASPAPASIQDSHETLDLLIKAHDGFTRDMYKYTDSHSSGIVRLDGPYGSMHAVDMMVTKQVQVVVAAGTGVAVAIPLLHELLRQQMMFSDPESLPTSRQSQIVLVLVVRSSSLIRTLRSRYLNDLEQRGVHLILPTPTEEGGRPDIEALLRQATESDRTKPEERSKYTAGVVCSAPDSMNRTVRNYCAREVWRGRNFDVAVEKFGW